MDLASLVGERHPTTLYARSRLAMIEHRTGRSESAATHLESVLAIQRREFAPDHPAIGETLSNLGRIAAKRGDHAAVAEYLSSALAIKKLRQLAGAASVLRDQKRLALALVELDRSEEALRLLSSSLEAMRKTLGADDRRVREFTRLVDDLR